jgi:hypothetical protein
MDYRNIVYHKIKASYLSCNLRSVSMADKDKSPAKPAKTQYEINKEMLDEMAGKPGTPVKPPKPTAKPKISEAEEGDPTDKAETKATSKAAVMAATKGGVDPQEWDTYTQGKWTCNDCDVEFRHFCPQLSLHMSQTKHNFSLVDVATGEVKSTSLSEARLWGFINKPSKKKKRKSANTVPDATSSVVPGKPPQKDAVPGQPPPETPPPPELPDRVAQFMESNPALIQWLIDNPGATPPDDLLNKEPVGSPQVKSSLIVKFVQSTAEVSAALDVLYDLTVSHPASVQSGYAPTRGEWMEDVILQYYMEHGEEMGLGAYLKNYMEGSNGRR